MAAPPSFPVRLFFFVLHLGVGLLAGELLSQQPGGAESWTSRYAALGAACLSAPVHFRARAWRQSLLYPVVLGASLYITYQIWCLQVFLLIVLFMATYQSFSWNYDFEGGNSVMLALMLLTLPTLVTWFSSGLFRLSSRAQAGAAQPGGVSTGAIDLLEETN